MVYWGWGWWGSSLKSYAEITAMTKANALTELNSHAVDYYTKFIDEGKMIAGKYLSTETNASVFLWSGYYIQYSSGAWSDVQVGDAEETILVVMMANENGDLYVPADYSTSANWDIWYDWGAKTQYTKDWYSLPREIKIGENLWAYSKHLIEITPHSSGYWWANAFRFYGRNFACNYKQAPLLTWVIVDWWYKWYGTSATNTWHNFRRHQYSGCVNLEEIPLTEVLPNTVTTIWDYFRANQYYGCTLLTSAATEVLPNTVTSVGGYFRQYQYAGCGHLLSVPTEVFTSWVTTIWDYFRSYQYQWCSSIKTPATEVLPNAVTSVGNSFRWNQYQNCISLTSAAAEVLPNTVASIWTYFRQYQYASTASTSAATEVLPTWVTTIPNYFRYNQYYGCTLLTSAAAAEVLPNTVTSVWTYFRGAQYQNCLSLASVPAEVLPTSVTSVWTNFRYNQYYNCISLTETTEEVLPNTVTTIWGYFRANQYYGCSKINNIVWWRDLSIWASNYRNQQFYNCNTNKTVTVLTDVWYTGQSNTLLNQYVTQVNVPSAYLSNFVNSTKQPRTSITDSKFVWY